MVAISFTSNLQRHVPCPPTNVQGGTVGEVLEQVFAANPRLRSYLVDEQGRLRKHVNIWLDDKAIEDRLELSDTVANDTRLYVFQLLTGG